MKNKNHKNKYHEKAFDSRFLAVGMLLNGKLCTKPKAKHVVYIGLDGWGSYSMPKANMPTVKSLMETGCYTMQKRTVLPSSSAVNWASMFMGAGPEVHGYTEWGSRTPELPSRVIVKNNIFPTIFQIYRDANPKAENRSIERVGRYPIPG